MLAPGGGVVRVCMQHEGGAYTCARYGIRSEHAAMRAAGVCNIAAVGSGIDDLRQKWPPHVTHRRAFKDRSTKLNCIVECTAC